MALLTPRAAARALSLVGLAGAALANAAFPASPQAPSLPFPLRASADGADVRLGGEAVHLPDLADLARLVALDRVLLTGAEGPGGTSVTLDLERIDTERRGFGFRFDGVEAPDALAGLSLSVWKGAIVGDPFSDVMLGFSTHGCQGWIKSREGLLHVLPARHGDGSWFGAGAVLVREDELAAAGVSHDFACGTAPPTFAPTPSALMPIVGEALRMADTVEMRQCPIAMETDFQLYQRFNNASALTAYLATLFTFISDRYETQAATLLTFPYVQIYTNANDPWTSQDNGGSAGDLLNEFRGAWAGNVPMGARLGHFMSGASLGGGVAYLDVLCSNSFNFGVSGNINGNIGFPVVQGPNNWDFMVVAHELGHNFSSPHTHDFCPPLDECAPSGYFGNCQSQQTCTTMGTIMSYCHLCSGGTANITTFFHPEAAALMETSSAACNPLAYQVQVAAPSIVSAQSTTPVALAVTAGDVSAARLVYAIGGTPFPTSVNMAASGATFSAALPAVPCGDTVEFWFEFDVVGLGMFTAPRDAQVFPYEALGGNEILAFADDFQADLGWTTENLGATSGDWERGVPVNDPNWAYDPAADADGSGACFLTENALGNTDVDNGAVRLTSPAFDLSAPGTTVSYSYFLRLTNSDGVDRMLVEARSGAGAWAEVTRHDTDGGLAWRAVTLTAADFSSAGVAPSAAVQVRFTVNDGNAQSIVEAGLDAFRVGYVDCSGIGTSYCGPAVTNNSGGPATIRAEGSTVAADNDLTLYAEGMPASQFCMFLTSRTQAVVPNVGGGPGTLCIGGNLGRYVTSLGSSSPAGAASFAVDLTLTPEGAALVPVLAGEAWNYQAWFRDFVLGMPSSNLTDAVSITYQ